MLPNRDWNRGKLLSLLPEDICSEILKGSISGSECVEDTVIWNHPKEIEFSVKSAYKEISNSEQMNVENHRGLIWKWLGKQRNRVFMWLCAKNKILTTIQRRKKNFTSNAFCPICKVEEEPVTQTLRDCPACKDVWKMLIKPICWQIFFSGNIVEWFIFNSKREIGKIESINWKVTFGEAMRNLWLQRNAFIFKHQNCGASDLYWKTILAAREFADSRNVLSFSELVSSEIRIGWEKPEAEWVKCNVDSASGDNGLEAGCGGLLRDSNG